MRNNISPSWRTIFTYFKDAKSDWKPKALFALALLYLIFPFDLVPDFAPFVGWLDDLGFLTLSSLYVMHVSRRYESERQNRKSQTINE